MADVLDELSAAIDKVRNIMGPKPVLTEIRVSSVPDFQLAVEAELGYGLHPDPTKEVVPRFAGVRITESGILPKGYVVLMSGEEVVGIVDLNRKGASGD